MASTPKLAESLAIATQHHQAGRLGEAEHIYRQILQVEPRHPHALHQLGLVALANQQFAEAIQLISGAIRADGGQAAFHANLGEACANANRASDALACYRQALALQPSLTPLHAKVGALLFEQGKSVEAEAALREAVRLQPDDLQAHADLGRVLHAQQKLAEAEVCYRQVIRLDPAQLGAHKALGAILSQQGLYDEAIAVFREALELGSDPSVAGHLSDALQASGWLDQALRYARLASEACPDDASLGSRTLYLSTLSPTTTPASNLQAHRAWAEKHAEPLTALSPPHANRREPRRKIRLGYLSADFCEHVAYVFTEPLLKHHDHNAFEVFCYANVTHEDHITRRFRSYADHWRSIASVSDELAAELIRRDEIDILVDLAGHTAGNRALTFARKPAPVQVSYLGYQSTTGMQAIDYRLTDAWSDPPGVADEFYSERLVRLPTSFFCYQSFEGSPAVGPAPQLRNGHVTFGVFSRFEKVSPEVISAWSAVLLQVPDSKLSVTAYVSDSLRKHVLELFAAGGVAPDRIRFTGRRPYAEYFQALTEVDIVLDPFPVNGHTTTCDALWMGVPVIMVAGQIYLHRCGGAALVDLGLADLIADSPAGYIEKAVSLAADLDRREQLRRELRAKMAASPMLDAGQFVRELEAAYRQMWVHWCAGPAQDKSQVV